MRFNQYRIKMDEIYGNANVYIGLVMDVIGLPVPTTVKTWLTVFAKVEMFTSKVQKLIDITIIIL